MSVRLPPAKESSRSAAVGTSQPSSGTGWQAIPHINQLRPKGANKDYANGAYNCAPAVVAMVARGWGRMGHLNDAELIQKLGKGIVTDKGTDADGLTRMLARVDVPPAGEALGANYSDKALREHLSQGHKLIAQVQSFDPKTRQGSAHYVLVQRVNSQGNYVISDPLSNKTSVVTPRQLQEAVRKAPPDGGMLIPIASPNEGKQAAAAPAKAQPVAAPAPRTPPAVPAAPAPKSPPATPDAFEPAKPSLATLAKALSGLTAAPLAPDPNAFTATDEVFDGVDTSYREQAPEVDDPLMRTNEEHNQFKLDVSYRGADGAEATQDQPVTPESLSAEEFAQQLLSLKESGDEQAYQTLAQLEKSSFDKDAAVLEHVKRTDKKQPGIGKKTTGVAF
ncbi:C39 family peptidase [Hyalangium rubrum]|uniref:Peptidase C39-like domain-containing protein n=1 Tax=Hyalangium rubrum TaxID=3103134 RepID=A0ABU5HBW1_9BACT|nr:C39 family peptidase [Hyalangium sp. s54d21]MDY7230957.1 hypothetical protein [Hyalangium sp. s54d21]